MEENTFIKISIRMLGLHFESTCSVNYILSNAAPVILDSEILKIYDNDGNIRIEVKNVIMGKIAQELMDVISGYMDDSTREQVHLELAPCEPEEFLNRYLELNPGFEKVLKEEFNIERN